MSKQLVLAGLVLLACSASLAEANRRASAAQAAPAEKAPVYTYVSGGRCHARCGLTLRKRMMRMWTP